MIWEEASPTPTPVDRTLLDIDFYFNNVLCGNNNNYYGSIVKTSEKRPTCMFPMWSGFTVDNYKNINTYSFPWIVAAGENEFLVFRL